MKAKIAVGILATAALAIIWLRTESPAPAPRIAPEAVAPAPKRPQAQAHARQKPSDFRRQHQVPAPQVQTNPGAHGADVHGPEAAIRDRLTQLKRDEAGRPNQDRGSATAKRDSGRAHGQSVRGTNASHETDGMSSEEDSELDTLVDTAFHNPDPEERANAIRDLDQYDAEVSRPLLLQALKDQDPRVRLAAVEGLAQAAWDDVPPFDALAQAAQDPDPEIRQEALKALDNIDDPRKEPLIRAALKDQDEDVRLVARQLAPWNPEVDPAVDGPLEPDDGPVEPDG